MERSLDKEENVIEQKKKVERVKTRVEISDLLDKKTGLPQLKKLLEEYMKKENSNYIENVNNLLDLYKNWSKNVRPGISFEQFIAQLYKLGKNEIMCDWLRNEENKERADEEEFNFQAYEFDEKATENLDEIERDFDGAFDDFEPMEEENKNEISEEEN